MESCRITIMLSGGLLYLLPLVYFWVGLQLRLFFGDYRQSFGGI